jgi:hypothetical protein
MTAVLNRLKPASGFSHFLHLGLLALLPAMLFVLVRIRFVQLGFALILLSKWRMFAVRPRYWFAYIRQNAVDIMVGVSLFIFMAGTLSSSWQLIWALAYAAWLLFIKPGSSVLSVSLQAFIAQFVALVALFIQLPEAPTIVLVLAAGLICYLSARHFFSSFDEPYASLFAHTWGYFAAALLWLLSHWLLFYGDGVISQPTLLLTVLGFGLGALYYLDQTDRLSKLLQRQVVFAVLVVIVIVLLRSDWSEKVI